MLFKNFPSVIFHDNAQSAYAPRCFINSTNGAAILKNYSDKQILPFTYITQDYELKYIAINEIATGGTNGNESYFIKGTAGNTNVIFEAGSTIRLEPGFTAQNGCSFTAYCTPLQYVTPACASPSVDLAGGGGNNSRMALIGSKNSLLRTEELNSLFQIFPNPGTGIFKLNFQNPNIDLHYTVSDVYGRKIITNISATENKTIDLTEQAPGIYIVTAYADNRQWVQKISKQ